MFWHFRITIFKTNYNFPVFLLIDSILKYTGSFVTMFLRWHCFDRCFIATDVAYVVKSALLTPFAKFTVFEKIVKMSHLISIAKLKNETFLDIQYTVEKQWGDSPKLRYNNFTLASSISKFPWPLDTDDETQDFYRISDNNGEISRCVNMSLMATLRLRQSRKSPKVNLCNNDETEDFIGNNYVNERGKIKIWN